MKKYLTKLLRNLECQLLNCFLVPCVYTAYERTFNLDMKKMI